MGLRGRVYPVVVVGGSLLTTARISVAAVDPDQQAENY
jgi:hypothetical protein